MPRSRFAVGKPSRRPSWSPRTTVPRHETGLPRSRAAVARSPSSMHSRIFVLETACAPTCTCGTTSTASPSSAIEAGVPERSRPNLESQPSTKRRAERGPRAFIENLARASRSRRRSSKCSTHASSMPARANSSRRCSRLVKVRGARPSSSAFGWSAKVTTAGHSPWARARSTLRSRMARWPRCTPSNTPMETVAPRVVRGGASRPRATTSAPRAGSGADMAGVSALARASTCRRAPRAPRGCATCRRASCGRRAARLRGGRTRAG